MSRLTIGIVLLFTAAAIVFLLVAPQWSATAKTRSDIQRLQALNDELTNLAAERDRLTKEYNAISEDDLVKLDSIAPSNPSTGSALVDLEALANKNGMFLSRIDFTADTPNGRSLLPSNAQPFAPLTVSLVLRGSYTALESFLNDIEHAIRITDISDMNFSSAQSGADQISVNLKGTMYYRP